MSYRCVRAWAVMVVLAGCSTMKPKSLDPHANVGRLLSALEDEVHRDQMSPEGLVAPRDLARAADQIRVAQRAHRAGEPRDRILKEAGLAEAHVDRAREVIAERRPIMDEVIQMREAALAARAPTARVRAVDDQFRRDFPQTDSGRVKLLDAYREVEVNAVTDRELSEARAQVNEAQRLDSARVAPNAQRAAQFALVAAERAIAAAPRDRASFATAVRHAENLSRALAGLTAQARAVGGRTDEDVARELLLARQSLAQSRAELEAVELNVAIREAKLREAHAELEMNAALERAREALDGDPARVKVAGDRLLILLKNGRTPASTLTKVKGVILKTNAREVRVGGGDPRAVGMLSESLNEVTTVGISVGADVGELEVSLKPELNAR